MKEQDSTYIKLRTFSMCIIAILILIISVNFFYNLLMRKKEQNTLIYQEAKAITELFVSVQKYISDKQDIINSCPDGSYHFKGLNPETVGTGVSDIFNLTSNHRLKMVSLFPRNPDDYPDRVELPILKLMKENPSIKEYFKRIQIKEYRYYYFLKRLDISPHCLKCHGGPKGSTDITGYPREGMKNGDFIGAISIRIPADVVSSYSRQNFIFLFIFTFGIAIFSLLITWYFLRKIALLSQKLSEANQVLTLRNKQLETLKNLKEQLFHMLVHDMKAPLTFMKGSLQMLKEPQNGTLNPDQSAMVDLVFKGVHRLENMISNILDVNRLEEGKMTYIPVEVDLEKLFSEKEIIWQNFANRENKEIKIKLSISSKKISTDINILERIIENLVNNAFKHTRKGEGKIILKVSESIGDKYIRFEVRDNGEGIPEEYKDKIFEKYTLSEKQELGLKTDTGLGLTFCKLAVEFLGGQISFESKKGKGTNFFFTIPKIPPKR